MLTNQEKRSILMENYLPHKDEIDSRIARDIERYRKGDCRIKVADRGGVTVRVAQKTHDFKFGANIFLLDELENQEENEKYKAFFKDTFNLATVPFYWDALEPEEGKPRFEKDSPKIYRRPAPEKCMEFCEKNGIETKLHCLVYDKYIPDWLHDLPLAEAEAKYEARIAEIAHRYKGRMYEFEVVNELLAESDWTFKSAVSGKRDVLEWAFALAKKYLPEETLVINETTSRIMLNKGYRCPYFMLIDSALLRGVPIDKIGIQHHMFTGVTATNAEEYEESIRATSKRNNDPVNMLRSLDTLYEHGLPLEITEVTAPTFGDTPEDEDLQADLLELWYSLWFSHPGMEGIVYWNSADNTAYVNSRKNENNCRGGLLHRDMTPKKSGLRLQELLNERWRTNLTLETDDDGYICFRGFYGNYEARIGENTLSFGIHK